MAETKKNPKVDACKNGCMTVWNGRGHKCLNCKKVYND